MPGTSAWRATGATALLSVCAAVATPAQEVPRLTEPVTDLAHVIEPAIAGELDRRIRSLQSASGDAVVVLTVPTYAPFGSIEEFAVRVFERSGAGERGQDNGVLIVLAVTERRVRIEVGYGLEEFVPDGFAGDTIRQAMLPAFREGRYGDGLLAGTTRVIQRIADRRGLTLSGVPVDAPPAERAVPALAFVMITLILILVILAMIRRSGGPSFRRRGWRQPPWGGRHGGLGGFGGGFGGFGGGFGGGGHGGFGGFGGGRSGGGGASGGW